MKNFIPFVLALLVGTAYAADDKVVNIYSARHYQSDETLRITSYNVCYTKLLRDCLSDPGA